MSASMYAIYLSHQQYSITRSELTKALSDNTSLFPYFFIFFYQILHISYLSLSKDCYNRKYEVKISRNSILCLSVGSKIKESISLSNTKKPSIKNQLHNERQNYLNNRICDLLSQVRLPFLISPQTTNCMHFVPLNSAICYFVQQIKLESGTFVRQIFLSICLT